MNPIKIQLKLIKMFISSLNDSTSHLNLKVKAKWLCQQLTMHLYLILDPSAVFPIHKHPLCSEQHILQVKECKYKLEHVINEIIMII